MGTEWFAILIPVIAGLFVRTVFHHKVAWWEVFMPMLATMITIPLIRMGVETTVIDDTERLGSWVTRAEYYEDWNQYVHQTCTRTVGSGKNQRIETYDCSYVRYIPEHYQLVTCTQLTIAITKQQYAAIVDRFGNNVFEDMYRDYHDNDGDKYVTTWDGDLEKLQPVTTEEHYGNRVQASHGVLTYQELDDTTGLHAYPPLNGNYLDDSAVLGYAPGSVSANAILKKANALLGPLEKVRIWLLIIDSDDVEMGFKQEAYWAGGNANELVICVGSVAGETRWCHVFCWSPDDYTGNTELAIDIRNHAMSCPKCGVDRVAEYAAIAAEHKFRMKDFKEFAYLVVDLPQWGIITIYVITAIITGLVCCWAFLNDLDNDDHLWFAKILKTAGPSSGREEYLDALQKSIVVSRRAEEERVAREGFPRKNTQVDHLEREIKHVRRMSDDDFIRYRTLLLRNE